MKDMRFLPLWYRNKMEIKNYKTYKLVIVFMITVIVINTIKFIKYKNYYDDINSKIRYTTEKLKIHKGKNMNEENTKSCGIKTYYKLNKELFNKVNFDEICINDDVVSVQGTFDNMISVIDVINDIELNKYNIQNVNIENLNENKVLLNLNFKVCKYE